MTKYNLFTDRHPYARPYPCAASAIAAAGRDMCITDTDRARMAAELAAGKMSRASYGFATVEIHPTTRRTIIKSTASNGESVIIAECTRISL